LIELKNLDDKKKKDLVLPLIKKTAITERKKSVTVVKHRWQERGLI
jgi:hypothetical protein